MSRGVNGPTGTCVEHGPFLYFCNGCHQRWADSHPLTRTAIDMMADPKVSYSKAAKAYAAAKKKEPT